MASSDVELEQQLKEAGKQLSHPSDSIDELLRVLDQVERLLSKVDQSPDKSMLDALKPSMKALIQDSLLRHSDVDVTVAVASCISEITRITAPDAPYNDDQMRDVFQLIVSSFEQLADQSSRSYNKRASILETVSKVRSCVVMLDLECDELIVEMFEHFLRSVRDYHIEPIYSSMENIMVLVLEESEDISVEMLKPLLASVKKDNEGVLPVARKLGEGVLLRSADKLKPYLKQAVISLGDTLDKYTKIVAAVCEGTTATFEHNDENASEPQQANESKLEKGSTEEAQQADESKLTTASSDQTDQVVKEEDCPSEVNPSPTLDRSPKSVMSNGVNAPANEEASVDQEPSKKPVDEVINQENVSKEDTDDSDAEKESKPEEETSKRRGKKVDTPTNSTEPSDSSDIEGDKEAADKPPSETEKDDVKEPEIEKDNDVKESETEKDNDDVQVSSPKPVESKPATANVSSPSQSNSLPDESCVKKAVRSKKKQLPQQDEIASPSKSETPSDEIIVKKVGRTKNKGLTREDPPEETSDSDIKPKRAGKKAVVAKEVKPPPKEESEDSDSEATPLKKKEVKLPPKDESEDSDSDAKPLKKPVSKPTKQSGKKSKQSGKKMDVGEPVAKKPKQSGKKVDAKEEVSDSDDKPVKTSVKKGEKSKVVVEEEEETDSDAKPLKPSAKKGSSKKKDDVRKRASGKNVTEKDQAKSLSSDDEMDSSPKAATKSAKGEGNSKETPVTSAKRKRSTGKEKASDAIKYDKSLVGLKVKVWWPEDQTYYEGVIESFNSARKKHKVSYVDGDEETLNLKTQKWEILHEFSVRDEDETIEEAPPETNKKKKSKTDPAPSASQEKIKDSAKKVAKGSASKDNKNSGAKSTSQKTSGKATDAAAATSKETGKSKEDDETPKAGTKTVNKSKGKTPQSGSKSNTNGPPSKAKSGTEDVKTPESTKGKSTETTKTGSKVGSKKRKKRS